jgi:MFS transporter, FSR family, fosmidomycin resistance protein
MDELARFRRLPLEQHGRRHRALVDHVNDRLSRRSPPNQWLFADRHVGGRYAALRREQAAAVRGSTESFGRKLPAGHIAGAMTILIILLFSKNAYTASFTSYYTFYLIERFNVTVQVSQLMLFLYLVVGAVGVIVGGMIGDRIGRDRVIWLSILGSLPFALVLPYADLFWTGVLSVLISLIIASRP